MRDSSGGRGPPPPRKDYPPREYKKERDSYPGPPRREGSYGDRRRSPSPPPYR